MTLPKSVIGGKIISFQIGTFVECHPAAKDAHGCSEHDAKLAQQYLFVCFKNKE